MASGQPLMHNTFKEIKIHTAKCDQCNKHNSATIYRCENCSEQCCTPCWQLQGEDGKHLLNHALTVIIPASEVEKRKKKSAKATKKTAKKIVTANKEIEEKRKGRRRKVIVDNDDDDEEDNVDMGGEVAIGIEKTIQANKKQLKTGSHDPDHYEDSSNPDVGVVSIPHLKDISQKTNKSVGNRLLAIPTFKVPVRGSKMRVKSRDDILADEGDTTDDDLPILPVPSSATSKVCKEFLKVTNANKRKRAEPSPEDRNTSGDHEEASSRKKACTGTLKNAELAVNASSRPQAQTVDEEIDIREMAETLISFSRVAPQSSPTPSPAASRNANGVTAHTNAHSELTRGSTARSSSPFADLPIWPPAPASKAAATLSTFPPSRDCYERAAAHQANSQASTGPAPREGMLNRTWYPGDAENRAAANTEYHTGVNAGLAMTLDTTDVDRPAANVEGSEYHESVNQEPDLTTTEQALELKQARKAAADAAYQQTERDRKRAGAVQAIEVVETITKTPLRKGIAHVKNAEPDTSNSRTLKVFY